MNFASLIRKLRRTSSRNSPGRASSETDSRHSTGRAGEREAERFLRAKGHRIIARNYDSPAGEVDLITTDGATIVFVEVKSRTAESGKDVDHIVASNQRERLIRAAQYFLRRADPNNRPSRFDVVTVYFPPTGKPMIEHFENAFTASGNYYEV